MSETPEGIYARIPLVDVTLDEARHLVEDASWFDRTRIPILFHFSQVGVDDYWSLRVGDHRDMVDFLVAKGLIDDGE